MDVGALVTEITADLDGMFGPPEIDTLDTGIDDSVTSLTLSAGTAGIRAGAYLQIDYEILRVTSVSGLIVNVLRGQHGSTPLAHLANSLIEVSPRSPRFQLLRLMREDIRSWPNDLHRINTVTFTVDPDAEARTFDLGVSSPDDYIRMLELRRKDTDSNSLRWSRVKNYEEIFDAPSEFSSGIAVYIPNAGVHESYRAVYASKFDVSTFTEATDLTNDVGIPESCYDIIKYGVMSRALIPIETRRVKRPRQGQSRTPQEVPAGAKFQTGAAYKQFRDSRIAEEIKRLQNRYGIRLKR